MKKKISTKEAVFRAAMAYWTYEQKPIAHTKDRFVYRSSDPKYWHVDVSTKLEQELDEACAAHARKERAK
jgi:hypothetical protein